MANYGTMLRPSALAAGSKTVASQAQEQARSAGKALAGLARPRSFALPTDAEAAAVRVVRNVIYFRFYYTLLLWIVLFVSLVPRRPISLLFFVATSAVTVVYLSVPRVFPRAVVLYRVVDRRLMVSVLAVVIVVQLVVTRALKHLLVSLAIAVPVVMVHAVLRVGDDLFVSEEAVAAGELVPLVGKKEGKEEDIESAIQ